MTFKISGVSINRRLGGDKTTAFISAAVYRWSSDMDLTVDAWSEVSFLAWKLPVSTRFNELNNL